MPAWPLTPVALIGSMVATRAVARARFDPFTCTAMSEPEATSVWSRRNHAGNEVTLLEGVWAVVGSGLPLLAVDPAAAAVAWGAGVTGAYDDLHPDAARKGLRGHLGALLKGELSPGALKIVGLCATAAAGSWLSGRRNPLDLGLEAALVAGSANMANLFDLRPGRCLKVIVAIGLPLTSGVRGPAAAAALGASVVLLPADLKGVTMLGDTGANALGALLGHSAAGGSRAVRCTALAALTAGTLLSERVSFSAVIADNPVLHAVDQWGRLSRSDVP